MSATHLLEGTGALREDLALRNYGELRLVELKEIQSLRNL